MRPLSAIFITLAILQLSPLVFAVEPSEQFYRKIETCTVAGTKACANANSPLFLQWYGPGRRNCVAYNAQGRFQRNYPVRACKGISNPFDAFSDLSAGYSWKGCENKAEGDATIPFDQVGNFRSECAPDTLYSWHDNPLIKKIARQVGPHSILQLPSALYNWRTPMGSFAYGQDALRIKLKRDVDFVLLEKIPDFQDKYRGDCDWLAKRFNTERSVFVGRLPQYGRYSEYILCSSGPVHSWSHGSTLFQEEIKREVSWMDGHPDDFDGFSTNRNGGRSPYEIRFDTGGWEKSYLLRDLKYMAHHYPARKENIYFNTNVIPSVWDHFSTRRPGYFNPYSEPLENQKQNE